MPSKNIVVLVDGVNVNETSTTGTMLNLGTMLASNIDGSRCCAAIRAPCTVPTPRLA
jgi:outer membrane cobalamin receptor